MTEKSETQNGQPAIGEAALLGLCPRCGEKTLFASIVGFAPRCSKCQLDYSSFNVGDGPAAFLTMIIGALVMALAMWLQFTIEPAWWVHAIIWIPLTIVLTLFGLRMAKGMLLVFEYTSRAEEHRHDGSDLN